MFRWGGLDKWGVEWLFGGGYKFMVAVGSRPKQFKIKNRVWDELGASQTAAGRLKTKDFSGDPRSGCSARGFIGFGEERGVMIE